MFKVYILQSLKNQRYYIGHTEDMDERLRKHNGGSVKSTKFGRPWKIIRTEDCATKSEAATREMEIKKYKGGILFKKLIGLWKES